MTINKLHICSPFRLFIIIIISLCAFPADSASFRFHDSSVLATGKWVKIKTSQTGLYEISYDTLRQMGFENPDQVGVYGKGGVMLPLSFTDGTNNLFEDDLVPVKVIHRNGKLYFYGQGTEVLEFQPSLSKYEKVSRNIYSNDGAYFLSDSNGSAQMATFEYDGGDVKEYTKGFDYIYHESDLEQNTTQSGQLFWGENLLSDPSGFKWNFSLPYLNLQSSGKLECKVYAADKSKGSLYYGATDAKSGNRIFTIRHPSPAGGTKENPEFMYMSTPAASLSLTSTDVEIYIRTKNAIGDFLNLDYWIFNYHKLIPDLSSGTSAQERLSVATSGVKPGKISVPYSDAVKVIDVTDPSNPMMLAHEKDAATETSSFFFSPGEDHNDLLFCNLDRPQLNINGYSHVDNTDLHSRAAKGAELVIISVPRYLDFANRLAELHRKYDGIDVIVASSTDIYNEFSGGIPDPMAFRSLMKMTYDADPSRMKNLLIVGKVYGDFRSILNLDDAEDYVIGYQENKVSVTTRAANVMDYYGFADDVTNSSLQNNRLQVGVGVLPLFNEKEGDDYLRKVEAYLNDSNKAAIVNEFMTIGGIGDNHTHDQQAVQLGDYIQNLIPGGASLPTVAIDAYGEKDSKKKVLSEINYGKLFVTYTGHGGARGPESTKDVLRVPDIATLNNKTTGFMFLYACDQSDTDYARKGFGEQIVTDTKNGMIGCVFAPRTVWSGQNFELSKQIAMAMFADPVRVMDKADPSIMRSLYRKSTPTFGEIYADAKSISNYINSLSYFYVGDPALKVPVPLRKISVSHDSSSKKAGEKITIKGQVLPADTIPLFTETAINASDNSIDKDFNGEIVVKLMSPAEKIISRDFLTDTKSSGKELSLIAPSVRLAEFKGKITDGTYALDIVIPSDIEPYIGKDLQLIVSAYDPSSSLAASGYSTINVETGKPSSSADNTAPKIIISQDAASRTILVEVSDDTGISSSGVTALIDGEKVFFAGAGEDDSRHLDLRILTDSYHPGTYRLDVTASDIAGNKQQASKSITIDSESYPLSIGSDRKVTEDEISFYCLSEDIPSDVKAVIADRNGNILTRLSGNGNIFTWDCLSVRGTKVNAGLYKAKLEATAIDGSPLQSAWLPFVVR